MKKLQLKALIFISITLGFIFILSYLFLVLTDINGGYVDDGLSLPLALIVLAELTPVFALLYLAAALLLKAHYREEKSAWGNKLLAFAIVANAVLWYGWAHESVRSDAMRPLFLPAIALGIGIPLLLSLFKISPEPGTNQ